MAGLRQHVPGAHPDENLYATSIMPLGAIFAGGVSGGERDRNCNERCFEGNRIWSGFFWVVG